MGGSEEPALPVCVIRVLGTFGMWPFEVNEAVFPLIGSTDLARASLTRNPIRCSSRSMSPPPTGKGYERGGEHCWWGAL